MMGTTHPEPSGWHNEGATMKTIATILASTVLAMPLVGTTAAPASANYGWQICWADPADPDIIHHPAAIEEGDDTTFLAGMIVRPRPDSAVGCQAYDGVPLDPTYESLYPGTPAPPVPDAPEAPDCEPVEVEVEVIRTVEVQDPTLVGKIARQRAKIAHLRSVIRHLRTR